MFLKNKIFFFVLLLLLLTAAIVPIHGFRLSSDLTLAQTTQALPITAQARIDNEIIDLEVALSPEQQSMGLMYRPALAANQGMLFIFDPPRKSKFWMKNVLIPLDIIFLRDGKVVAIFPDLPPCHQSPCPTYGPDSVVDQVLELTGGRSAELNLVEGDQVIIHFLESTQ